MGFQLRRVENKWVVKDQDVCHRSVFIGPSDPLLQFAS